MRRPAALLLDRDPYLDSGQTTVEYFSLFPDAAVKPTDANVNAQDVPREGLRLLVVRGRRFLPVTNKMWIGALVTWGNVETILAPVKLSRTEDWAAINLWRPEPGSQVDPDPNALTEQLAWEVDRRGLMFAHRVDRAARDAGGTGFFDPFLVQPEEFGGHPVFTSTSFLSTADTITVYRRNRRMPAGFQEKEGAADPMTLGTGLYATNAEVASEVTLIWRDDAEGILRQIGDVPDGPIQWTWYKN